MLQISVVIPVYKVEQTLDRCVASVLSQFGDKENASTASIAEVILVDDGSPDCCPQMCDSWAKRDARVRVFHKPNGGLSDARNYGIEKSRGEYVTFVDSDDELAPDTLLPLLSLLTDNPDCDVLEYPIVKAAGSIHESRLSLTDCKWTSVTDYWLETRAWEHTYACNKIYRRQIFEYVKFPVGRVYEDMWFLPEILSVYGLSSSDDFVSSKKHLTIMTSTHGEYLYRWNEAGISSSAGSRQLWQLLVSQVRAAWLMRTSPFARNAAGIYRSMAYRLYDIIRLGLKDCLGALRNVFVKNPEGKYEKPLRVLLLGEYSNVHYTLAAGLRQLGCEVTLASNGDFWKDYPRDIDLSRGESFRSKVSFFVRLLLALPRMRGYDVVQLINPMFIELKAERLFPIYRYLRRHNRKMILGAFGMDYYWVHVNDTLKPLRYSDFNFGEELRHDPAAEHERKDWIGTAKQRLNEYIAADCDAIVSGLYEYWVTYADFSDKMKYIPYPVELLEKGNPINSVYSSPKQITIFVGISRNRSAYKGTDVMLRAAQRLAEKYPERVRLQVAEGVPFEQYQRMIEDSDLLLDQLYSYTPAMNGLLAMSKGIVLVGGGEEEHYVLLDEYELRPIVNVQPSENSVYEELERLVMNPELIPQLKRQSVEYVRRHHDYMKVASQYLDLYTT